MAIDDYDPIFQAAAQEWNIDPTLLKAVAHVESGGNPGATSPVGAMGVMQIMPGTAQQLGVTNARDPVQAIYGAAKLLDKNLRQYGNVDDALRAYNAGDPSRWNNIETHAYVPKIAAAYQQYAPPPASRGTAVAGPGGPNENDTIIANAVDRLRPAPGRAMSTSPNAADQQGQDDPFSQIMRSAQGGGASDSSSDAAGSPAAQTDDDPFSKIMRAAQPPTSSSTSSPPSAPIVAPHPAPDGSGAMTNLSDADYQKFNASAPAIPSVPAAPTNMPPSAVSDITTYRPQDIDTLQAAVGRAARDITDVPAQLLARGADAVGLNRLIGAPTGADVAAGNANALASYNQQYGNNPAVQAIRGGLDFAGAAIPGALAAKGVTTVGNALLGTGLLPQMLVTSPLAGAAAGAVGQAAIAGSSDQPIGAQLTQAAKTGAILGAVTPLAGRLVGGVANALVGGGTPQDVAQLAQTARNQYGIPVTGGQISTSPAVRILDSVTKRMPFSGAGAASEAQQTAFNRAVAGTFGETTDSVTPDVMSRARDRIGQMFDDVAQKTTIRADPQLFGALQSTAMDAKQVLTTDEQKLISNQINNVANAIGKGNGAIEGPTYQALTRRGAPLDRAMQSDDPNVKYYAGQVKDALDDAMSRSVSPALQAQLQTARAQWRNMRTVENLVEKSPTGDISSALLQSQVNAAGRKLGDRTAYGGGGDLATLGRIGQQFLKEPGSSNTAERAMTMGALLSAPGVALTNPLMAAQTAAGLAAGRLTGAYLRSPFYTNMLIQNALAGGGVPDLQSVLPLATAARNALVAQPALSGRQ